MASVYATWNMLIGTMGNMASEIVANFPSASQWREAMIDFYNANNPKVKPLQGSGYTSNVYIDDSDVLSVGNDVNVISQYGSKISELFGVLSQSTQSVATGELTGGNITGVTPLNTEVDELGNVVTSTLANSLIGSTKLSQLLIGTAYSLGLAVNGDELYNNLKEEYKNFMLDDLVKSGVLTDDELNNIDPDKVKFNTLLKGETDISGNSTVVEYVNKEAIEKTAEFLYNKGAFNKAETREYLELPEDGTTITQGFVVSESTFQVLGNVAMLNINTDKTWHNDIKSRIAEIMTALYNKISEYITWDNSKVHNIRMYSNFAFENITTFDISVYEYESDAITKNSYYWNDSGFDSLYNLLIYSTIEKNTSIDFNTKLYSLHSYIKSSNVDDIINNINSSTIRIANTNLLNLYQGSGFYITTKSEPNVDKRGSSYTVISDAKVTTIGGSASKVNGIEFTDHTLTINDISTIADIINQLAEKDKIETKTAILNPAGDIAISKSDYLALPLYLDDTLWQYPSESLPVTGVTSTDATYITKIIDDANDLIDSLSKYKVGYKDPEPPTENYSSVVPPTSILGVNGSGLWSVYNPTLSQINSFGAWLWSSNIFDQIKQYFSDPMQGVIGLHKIYCKPTTGGSSTIVAGYLDSGVSSNVVTNQYNRIECGSVRCAEYFGSALDYTPYTDVSLYLPFIGIVTLNTDIIMGSVITVYYDVDVLTGACLATVSVTDSTNTNIAIYQFNGVCSVQIPLTSGNYGSVLASLVTTGATIGATVASGGALAPVALGGAVSALNAGTNVKQEGTIGSNIGAMAYKKPYLIITRKIPVMPTNYNQLSGYPSNQRVTIGNVKGFTRFKDIYISSSKATNEEKERIEELLKTGVYI